MSKAKEEQVDINQITDVKELKAIAFDLQAQGAQINQQLQLVLAQLQKVQSNK